LIILRFSTSVTVRRRGHASCAMRPAKPAPVEVAVKPAAGPQDGEAQADQPVDRVDVDTLPPR
jgi:hypothetical protein